ncbi:MAG: YdjY domain-containing protein [Verrucomicrobiota bacterium]
MLLFSPAAAEDEAVPFEAKEGQPVVTKIGNHRYRLGEILIDSKAREIRIPVVVNMREGGPIEYILVHENGKVHESILTTATSPLQLQIAFQLLNFKSGDGDLFNVLIPPELLQKEGGNASDRGDSVNVHVRFDGEERDVDAAQFIIDGATANPMTSEPWVYTGSRIEETVFMAEVEGSIVAIYLDHLAMLNMTREGADRDERWGANGDAVPEIGTKGVLVFSLAEKNVTQ